MSSNIKDVAKLANVSISTVSRVINNASNVKPDTKLKVLDAIEKLNFKPNRIAQSLGGGLFNAIGVVFTRSSMQAFNNPYFSIILQAIGEITEDNGYDIIFNSSNSEENEYKKCINMIESKIVQGLILLSSRTNHRLIEALVQMNFPFVLVGKILDEHLQSKVYSVDTDNFSDSKGAVNYLISLGHRDLGCIHAPLHYVVSKERLDGFIEAHRESLLPVNYSLIEDGGYSVDDAYEATLKMFTGPLKPSAIFATDDTKAMGVYKALRELGLKVPDQVSVIGHNNYDIASIVKPSLTTIDVPIYQLGTTATDILFNLIEGNETEKRTILKTQLIKRESCRNI